MTTATAPKEHGILFKAEMVRAILNGTKHQTRRIAHAGERPRWRVGDRLWVRETFYCDVIPDGPLPKQRPEDADGNLYYLADGPYCRQIPECDCSDGEPKSRPALLMPRWASRITLEVTDVQHQYLSDITPEDAIAEGIGMMDSPALKGPRFKDYSKRGFWTASPVDSYLTLWDSINLEPKPLTRKTATGKNEITHYECYPSSSIAWMLSDSWKSKHLTTGGTGTMWKGKPLFIVCNPEVWALSFTVLETPAS